MTGRYKPSQFVRLPHRRLIQLTLPRIPASVLAFAVVVLAALTTPIPFVGAQTTPDPEQTSAAVPFIGEFEVWCTESNPGAMGLCQRSGHHSTPAIDFGMPVGATLRATGSGEVIEADAFCSGSGSCNNGAGNIVVIEHPDGRFSRYLHMSTVSVSVGQQVSTGDVLGANGLTGHRSSAHLHFDEQFPLGTRVNAGTMIACVDGAQVEYPAAFGVSEWSQVPFGSLMVNDGYDCFNDARPSTPSPGEQRNDGVPRVFAGPNSFAIAPPVGSNKALYEISLDHASADVPEVFRMTGGGLRRIEGVSGIVEIQARELIDGEAGPWSAVLAFDPTAAPANGPTCDGLYASQQSLSGTPQADVLIGTDGADVINGLGGQDIICAGSGDDTINAGRGADLVLAGSGNDTVTGGFGADVIHGGDGNDNIRGGNGPDVITGDAGDDTLHGTAGNDRVIGGADDDVVIGGIGHDRVLGSEGNDVLEGRNGFDFLEGGEGTDRYDGGNGNDRCLADSAGTEVAIDCER